MTLTGLVPPPVPHGYDEVKRTFGDITKYVREDGTLDPDWEETYICRIPLPAPLKYDVGTVSRVTCHKAIVDHFGATLVKLYMEGLWPKLREYGGGFEFRKKRGLNVPSLHSWGIAWDFDPSNNQLGTLGTMDQRIIMTFEAAGFEWGGNFIGRKDPMHFQYATGC